MMGFIEGFIRSARVDSNGAVCVVISVAEVKSVFCIFVAASSDQQMGTANVDGSLHDLVSVGMMVLV
jgi:hypothetical protein